MKATTIERPGARWWIPRVTIAAAVGVAIALGLDIVRVGGVAAWVSRHAVVANYDARGGLVDVGDAALYLDCRGSGTPTVILEAGMGSDASTWGPVIDDLAATTRTCAYDRIGRGRSDAGETHDLATISSTLARLLDTAGEHGPFVVVGHSFGGTVARVHAAARRDQTLGLVLVDGFDPDVFDEVIYPLLDGKQAEYAGHSDGLWRLIASVERLDASRSKAQLAAASLDGIPLEVIRAARYEAGLSGEANAAIAAATAAAYQAMSPGRTRLTIAYTGHIVQAERPDIVVDAVRRLVAGSRSGMVTARDRVLGRDPPRRPRVAAGSAASPPRGSLGRRAIGRRA